MEEVQILPLFLVTNNFNS